MGPGDAVLNGWMIGRGVTVHKATSSITDPDRKIFYRPTHGGECNCRLFYDGQEDLLFNVDNKKLLYYGFLLQYLHIMVEGKNPLAAFQRSCERSFSAQSLTKPIKVKLLRQAWNSFARLLDINWSDTFACPLCGPSPKVVVAMEQCWDSENIFSKSFNQR